MKFLAMLFACLIAMASAVAADPPVPERSQTQSAPPQRGSESPMPQRELRGPPEADRGRMNPDERRQLRRDIQDAGRDIYHPARNAPAPGRSGRGGRR